MRLSDLECRSPRWSPDGKWIVFTGGLGGASRLYIVGADGSDVRRLTDADAPETDAAWAPQGSRLAFASLRGAEWRLFTVGLDGGALTEVAAGRQPAWSPDGKRLALVRELDRLPQVHVATLGGTEATCLTRERHNDSPAWSPDGGRIAFASGRAGTSRLLAMSPDGSDQALFADVVASEPAWSPDGRTLAYTGTTQPRHARGPLPAGICLLNVADGGVRLSQSAAMGASPAWSPDGARIVFSRNFRLYVLEIGPDTAAPLGGAEGGRP